MSCRAERLQVLLLDFGGRRYRSLMREPLRGWSRLRARSTGCPECGKESGWLSVTDVTENPQSRLTSGHDVIGGNSAQLTRDGSHRLALFAGTDFAQEVPGINAQVVAVVPFE